MHTFFHGLVAPHELTKRVLAHKLVQVLVRIEIVAV